MAEVRVGGLSFFGDLCEIPQFPNVIRWAVICRLSAKAVVFQNVTPQPR